jgi:hypothetical protein
LLLAAIVATGTAGLFFALFSEDFVGYSMLLAVGLAAICYGVARASGDRFWPYGLAVFFSIALFGALLLAARFEEQPKMNPVALLRGGNSGSVGVVGLFVARDDDRYWLGTAEAECKKKGENSIPTGDIEGDSGRLFSVPRAQVLDDEIGSPTDVRHAAPCAAELFRELVAHQPPGGSLAPPESTATTPH